MRIAKLFLQKKFYYKRLLAVRLRRAMCLSVVVPMLAKSPFDVVLYHRVFHNEGSNRTQEKKAILLHSYSICCSIEQRLCAMQIVGDNRHFVDDLAANCSQNFYHYISILLAH